MKLSPWKVLIVDDEPDVHAIARLNLKSFEFSGKSLQFFEASSAQEAKQILLREPDIAVALIDVVMETDDAGLKLVEYIREELQNPFMRLIIRTGQPGVAPERWVIDNYDIDDYKDKTELTAQKLYTTMRSSLKSYRDLGIIDANRKGLKRILDSTPHLYQLQSIKSFFSAVLDQIINLCRDNFIFKIHDGLLITSKVNDESTERVVAVQAGSGRFVDFQDNEEVDAIVKICAIKLTGEKHVEQLPLDSMLFPLETHGNITGFIYLDGGQCLSKLEQDLVHIMVNQCAAALENLQLYIELKEANRQSLNMLAVAEQARSMVEAASRAKSTFLANMSHELRTPLNAILGYSDYIYEDIIDSDCKEILPHIEKIKTAGSKLLTIISDILDISQIEAGKVEIKLSTFSVEKLIQEAVASIQAVIKNESNSLTVNYAEDLGLLCADYQKMKQVLLNLLSNAAKFTKQGKITFSIVRELADEKNGQIDWIHFTIADTGIGIAPNNMDKIFKAFSQVDSSTTRKYGGTGLGLAISQHFCRLMGGNINVHSELNKGSVFTVHIPAETDKGRR